MNVEPGTGPEERDAVERAVATACAGPSPLIPRGAAVLVACSGGADSVALASALGRRVRAGGRLAVALGHVDHGLRPESPAEAEGVRMLASRLGVPYFLRRLTGLANAASERGLEAAARDARYAALLALAAEAGSGLVATGHTRSDQAETLLLRLARGAGPGALAGIRRTRALGPLRLVRPLLGVTRSETERYCAEQGLPFTRDPHNLDPRRARSRLRAELPRLAALLNPRLEEALSGAAALLADEDELLASLASAGLAGARVAGGLAVSALRALPVALLRRALLAAAAEAGALPERGHLERIAFLLVKGKGSLDLPRGRAAVEDGLLKFGPRVSAPARDVAVPRLPQVEVPGPGRYPWGGALLDVRPWEGTGGGGSADHLDAAGAGSFAIDVDRAHFPWVLRTLRRGDRFRPGGGREKKVSDLLIDARVPRSRRPFLALLQDAAGSLFFVEGLRPGDAGRGAMRQPVCVSFDRTTRELDRSEDGFPLVKRAGGPRASMHPHRPDEEPR